MPSPPTDPVVSTPAAMTDGRHLRSERNREAVLDAILALGQEGDDEPSVVDIAERAGVSTRSVFRHFDDLDALRTAAVDRHLTVLAPLFDLTLPVGVGGRPAPREARVAVLVAQRSRLYEKTAHMRDVSDRQRTSTAAVAEGIERVRRLARQQLGELFETELDLLGRADRRRGVDDLEAISSFGMWRHLRVDQGASVVRARATSARLLHAALASWG